MPPTITVAQDAEPAEDTDRTRVAKGPKLPRLGSEAASETSESDFPRGRPKVRNAAKQALATTINQGDTGESGTFRGRTRWRSTSPSRNASSGAKTAARAPSPARRVLLRVSMKHHHRSQSPSRPSSRDSEWRRAIRRRERTVSRSIGVDGDVRNSSGRRAGR